MNSIELFPFFSGGGLCQTYHIIELCLDLPDEDSTSMLNLRPMMEHVVRSLLINGNKDPPRLNSFP